MPYDTIRVQNCKNASSQTNPRDSVQLKRKKKLIETKRINK